MRSREQSLLQHLGELRRRVFICVVAVLVGSAVSFVFFEQIIDFLVAPAEDLNLGTGGMAFIADKPFDGSFALALLHGVFRKEDHTYAVFSGWR